MRCGTRSSHTSDAPRISGGPCDTPVAERLAADGLKYTRFHTTALCAPTRQALLSHQRPHIYVLGPSSVIPDSVLSQLSKFGHVKRVAGTDPASNSVTFATYRNPRAEREQGCANGHSPFR